MRRSLWFSDWRIMLIRFMVASSASFSGVSIWTAINFIFLCVPAGFLATLFVSRYYGDTYFHITLVEVIGFLGMMAGGLLISTWGGFKRHTKTLLVGMVSFGLLATLMGLVKNFYMYLVLMAVYEVALTMVQTVSTTLLQENSTPEMSGRVFGLFGAAYSSLLCPLTWSCSVCLQIKHPCVCLWWCPAAC